MKTFFPCILNTFMLKYQLSIMCQEVKILANIKSAIKRIKVTRAKTLRNSMRKSAMRTAIRRCLEAISSGNIENANANYRKAVKLIDSAAAKGILHKNTAARKKSQLTRKLNTLAQAQ